MISYHAVEYNYNNVCLSYFGLLLKTDIFWNKCLFSPASFDVTWMSTNKVGVWTVQDSFEECAGKLWLKLSKCRSRGWKSNLTRPIRYVFSILYFHLCHCQPFKCVFLWVKSLLTDVEVFLQIWVDPNRNSGYALSRWCAIYMLQAGSSLFCQFVYKYMCTVNLENVNLKEHWDHFFR